MSLSFNIDIHDPVIVYSLNGRITNDEDYLDFEREIFTYLNQNYYRIVFDLTDLTHTNSSGIGFFMRTLTKARIMGGDLVLANLRGNVQKIFEIAKLTEVYTICDDKAAGIQFFNTQK